MSADAVAQIIIFGLEVCHKNGLRVFKHGNGFMIQHPHRGCDDYESATEAAEDFCELLDNINHKN